MRDTFYVGYDPTLKLWDVSALTHSFEPDMWVFRVAARSDHEALLKGLDQYKAFMAPVAPDQERLFDHIRNQVGKMSRMLHEAMIIEIPAHLIDSARVAAEAGFFTLAGTDEVILNTSEVGWKAIQARHAQAPVSARKKHDHQDLAFG